MSRRPARPRRRRSRAKRTAIGAYVVLPRLPMIDRLDAIVLTTARTGQCIDFCTGVLRMKFERFGEGRMALKFGGQRINLPGKGKEFEPRAALAAAGTLDI